MHLLLEIRFVGFNILLVAELAEGAVVVTGKFEIGRRGAHVDGSTGGASVKPEPMQLE